MSLEKDLKKAIDEGMEEARTLGTINGKPLGLCSVPYCWEDGIGLYCELHTKLTVEQRIDCVMAVPYSNMRRLN